MEVSPIEALPLEGARLLILTGAGVSAESGLATFRDSNGLWEQHRVEDVASPEGFERDPHLVWTFYSLRRQQAATVRPNARHDAIAASSGASATDSCSSPRTSTVSISARAPNG